MSVTDYSQEPDEGLYQLYVGWCRAHQVTPSFKEYLQWKQEQNYDEDEPSWDEIAHVTNNYTVNGNEM